MERTISKEEFMKRWNAHREGKRKEKERMMGDITRRHKRGYVRYITKRGRTR